MKPESHIEAFEDRKETIFRWGIEVRGIERSQRIVGDNASKAIIDLLSSYLHKNHIIEEGFQINHTWFKSESVADRFPEFDNKSVIIRKIIDLERLCEKLSYGVQKPVEESRKALSIFKELEDKLKRDDRMNRESLIGYSMTFVSFLLDSNVGKNIRKIILFGSVARGDFTKDSDIDIFIDADKENEKEIEKQMKLFIGSKINEIWKMKGLENEISIKVGDLNKWSLKRSIISSGILLYGKYREVPENVKYYVLIRMNLEKLNYSVQMSIWRKLYGYKQKVGKKTYVTKGLLDKVRGKKLGKAVILVPSQDKVEIINFLNKNKVKYTINELWSDDFD